MRLAVVIAAAVVAILVLGAVTVWLAWWLAGMLVTEFPFERLVVALLILTVLSGTDVTLRN